MISTKQNYKTHDQKLLIIINLFKQWKHYSKNNSYSIEIWCDHNNFKNFMRQKKLNFKQARWALKLIVYDFEIFHRSKIKNSTNESSRRSNYENISSLNMKLLSTLQNKLTLSSNEKSLTQNEREKSNVLTFKSNVLIDITIVDERTLSQNKREMLKDLILMKYKLSYRERRYETCRKNFMRNLKNQWNFWLKIFK